MAFDWLGRFINDFCPDVLYIRTKIYIYYETCRGHGLQAGLMTAGAAPPK